MSAYDGGPAFPADSYLTADGGRVPTLYSGMKLRDYFAAKAMASCVSDPHWRTDHMDSTAELAYRVADAMLKARAA